MVNYKPIFLIAMPLAYSGDDVAKVQDFLQEKMGDYHVLAYHKEVTEVGFRAVYDKDLEEIDLERLRLEVLNSLGEKSHGE